ncbi:MAG TPA: hemerythrin domain-containing protein [Rhodothermales bacterium]|nr:hemerythrin domain-containing protein [Rhodothermales bacterium]
MKRSKHLEPLSHDHYEGLVVAGRLQKGLSKQASPDVMAAYVAHFWKTHLAHHFQQEETFLLPLLEESSATMAERMVEEHGRIRELVARVEKEASAQRLTELSRMMKAHIRFEEREVFPALEAQMPEDVLQEVGAQLQEGHAEEADLSWEPTFWA